MTVAYDLPLAAYSSVPSALNVLPEVSGRAHSPPCTKNWYVSAVRLLPPYARERFTTWFAKRPKVRIAKRQGRVAVFPTCLVEYQQPQIGHDLVKVYERNGIECSLAAGAGCCGAPWLHSGRSEEHTSESSHT